PDTRRRDPRDNTRTTRDIEHAVAAREADALDQILRPWQRHRRNEVTLVQLRRAAFELPLLRSRVHADGILGCRARSPGEDRPRMPLRSHGPRGRANGDLGPT